MIKKTQAIILNKIKYKDNSYIVNFFSKDYGRFAALIRISNTARSDIKTSSFFSLNIVDIEIKLKNTREVQNITYCNNAENLTNIILDINKLTIAQFIAEIILKTIKEEESNLNIFNYLKKIAIKLNSSLETTNNIHLLFLKDFASLSGFAFNNNYSENTQYFNIKEGMFVSKFDNTNDALDKKTSQVLNKLLNAKENYELNELTKSDKINILNKLLFYYEQHIPSFGKTKSLKILQEVFNA